MVGLFMQAHNMGDKIHDIDLESLNLKTVSEVRQQTTDAVSTRFNYRRS